MSSTGNVSRVFMVPTTTHTEHQRKVGSAVDAAPTAQNRTSRITGIIIEVSDRYPRLVKMKSAADGTPIANGAWIELNHSAQEIAERWGTVRVGFRARVTFSGPSGAGADAIIVGTENTKVNEPSQPNESARGLYAIFAPGIGVG